MPCRYLKCKLKPTWPLDMMLPVIDRKNAEDEGVATAITAGEILYCDYFKTMLMIHTPDKTYSIKMAMSDAGTLLKKFGFIRLDKGVILNPYRLTHVDKEAKKGYFDHNLNGQIMMLTLTAIHNIDLLRLPVTYL